MQIVTRYFIVKIYLEKLSCLFFYQFYFENERSGSDNLLLSSVPHQSVVMYFYLLGVPPLYIKLLFRFVLKFSFSVLKFSFSLLGLFSPAASASLRPAQTLQQRGLHHPLYPDFTTRALALSARSFPAPPVMSVCSPVSTFMPLAAQHSMLHFPRLLGLNDFYAFVLFVEWCRARSCVPVGLFGKPLSIRVRTPMGFIHMHSLGHTREYEQYKIPNLVRGRNAHPSPASPAKIGQMAMGVFQS